MSGRNRRAGSGVRACLYRRQGADRTVRRAGDARPCPVPRAPRKCGKSQGWTEPAKIRAVGRWATSHSTLFFEAARRPRPLMSITRVRKRGGIIPASANKKGEPQPAFRNLKIPIDYSTAAFFGFRI